MGQSVKEQQELNLGDIYWIKGNSEIPHPQVIIKIENDVLTACSLTTNQNKASMPGNIILEEGEGNLEKQSIVEVSKVSKIEATALDKFIGTLSSERVTEILNGIGFLHRTYFRK